MTYQIVYSSHSTVPMQSDDLEDLLERARARNAQLGISGALVYTDGVFLQILEGERAPVEALMAGIRKDVRHENVEILREGDIASARFSHWKMAYVAATPEQVARWAGVGESDESDDATVANLRRTAQFVRDILALLAPETSGEPPREPQARPDDAAP